MATRIYVAKFARDGEGTAEIPELEAWDYIDALRAGAYTYGDEVSSLRQGIAPLDDYIQKHGVYALSDGTLRLNVSLGQRVEDYLEPKTLKRLKPADAGYTRRALLICGSYTTFGKGDSRLTKDLLMDPSWQKITTLCAPGSDGLEPMFATFFDKHFGTDHKKLFIMIGSQEYTGQVKNGFPIRGIWKDGDREVDVRELDRWIDHMACARWASKEERWGKANPDWLSGMPAAKPVSAVQPLVEEWDEVLEQALYENRHAELLAQSRPNPSGVTKSNITYRPTKSPERKLVYSKHKFGRGAGAGRAKMEWQ